MDIEEMVNGIEEAPTEIEVKEVRKKVVVTLVRNLG